MHLTGNSFNLMTFKRFHCLIIVLNFQSANLYIDMTGKYTLFRNPSLFSMCSIGRRKHETSNEQTFGTLWGKNETNHELETRGRLNERDRARYRFNW